MTNIKDKFECVFLLHAIGDTLGFKNGEWEFNYGKMNSFESVLEYIFEFIDLGGINGIDMKDWIVSDDTLYHISTGKTLVDHDVYDKNKISENFIYNSKMNMIDVHNSMAQDLEDDNINRHPGVQTSKIVEKMSKKYDMRNEKYSSESGGNGIAMKSLCIGLAFYKELDLKKLIDVSITLGKLTHNSPIGFLAGFTSAFFTSLAIREIEIEKWPFLLVEILLSQQIKQHIDIENNNEYLDYIVYINYWKTYISTRFVDEKPLKTRSSSNMIFRIKYYYENFTKNTKSTSIGGSGYAGMIMAYDSLLDCDGKWEKIVFYSILHPGDSDTVGAIACGLYGAVYGYGDVPKNMLKYVEKKKTLLKLGKQMYNKYYK